jgi:hypothetical protein
MGTQARAAKGVRECAGLRNSRRCFHLPARRTPFKGGARHPKP